jgi:hypothetical protein
MAVIPEPKNALSPIICSRAVSLMNTDDINVFETNAETPIDITLLGMLKEVMAVSRNALSPIVSNRDDIANSIEVSDPFE